MHGEHSKIQIQDRLRELMELVNLNIGLDVGVLSPALFSMMVLMALVTTFMTAPLLEWVCPTHLILAEAEGDELQVGSKPA